MKCVGYKPLARGSMLGFADVQLDQRSDPVGLHVPRVER
jgi:hypothetical protein